MGIAVSVTPVIPDTSFPCLRQAVGEHVIVYMFTAPNTGVCLYDGYNTTNIGTTNPGLTDHNDLDVWIVIESVTLENT